MRRLVFMYACMHACDCASFETLVLPLDDCPCAAHRNAIGINQKVSIHICFALWSSHWNENERTKNSNRNSKKKQRGKSTLKSMIMMVMRRRTTHKHTKLERNGFNCFHSIFITWWPIHWLLPLFHFLLFRLLQSPLYRTLQMKVNDCQAFKNI